MNADASGAAPSGDRTCAECGAPFRPKRRWGRFCSAKCRTAHHAKDDGGLRGVVSKVSVMRRGVVSVVLRFDLTERDRAGALTPGDVIEVLRS